VQNYTLEQLDQFRTAVIKNVEELTADAVLLFANERFARATSLCTLAKEEICKLLFICYAEQSLKSDAAVDWEEVNKAMKSHPFKLSAAPALWEVFDVLIKRSVSAEEAIQIVDDEVFKSLSDRAKKLNIVKQSGFYVTMGENRAMCPSEMVQQSMATVILQSAILLTAQIKALDSAVSRFAVDNSV